MTHRKHTALRTALLLVVVFGPLVLVAVGLRYLVVRVERGEMVGVSQAIVLGVPAVVVLAMAVWVYRSASKLRASSMTPAQRLMLRQLNEDTTPASCPTPASAAPASASGSRGRRFPAWQSPTPASCTLRLSGVWRPNGAGRTVPRL